MMSPLKNALFCHSGLAPESSNSLKILDPGFRRNDGRETEMELFKGLMINCIFLILGNLKSGCFKQAERDDELSGMSVEFNIFHRRIY